MALSQLLGNFEKQVDFPIWEISGAPGGIRPVWSGVKFIKVAQIKIYQSFT